jgi:hypothetical protein
MKDDILDLFSNPSTGEFACIDRDFVFDPLAFAVRGKHLKRRTTTNPVMCECGDHYFDKATFIWLVLVSPEDKHLLVDYKWTAKGRSLEAVWYAQSARCWREAGKTGSLHRIITEHKFPLIDHCNRNGMDNRRSNLRPATNNENSYNQRKRLNGISKLKGAGSRPNGRWHARIRADGRVIDLGIFATENEAATAYDQAALLHHGEFACISPLEPVNQLKRISKRVLKGWENGKSTLREHEVQEIRQLLLESVLSAREIGEKYGVTASAIYAIKHHRVWEWLPFVPPEKKDEKA